MPRTSLPPTPVASGDIPGKDEMHSHSNEKTFNLPPPAISQSHNNESGSNPKSIQPATSPNFSLPPPPTRSRTIIQMKPKQSRQQNEAPEKRPTSKGSAGSAKKANTASGGAGKKQPSATSVAGKKIARKTAHSVIERRRRSKMNEEFGVLKAMIPACTDQEMHKLAILQASIDYLRYLEKCIADLKIANKSLSTPLLQPQPPPPRKSTSIAGGSGSGSGRCADDDDAEDEEEEDEDIAMEDAPSPTSLTPALSAQNQTPSAYTSPQSISASPALDPPRTSHRSSYSSLSALPSPAFGPQRGNHNGQQTHMNMKIEYQPRSQSQQNAYPPLSLSASTSPTIMPSNKEQDHEATAALLMLNQDRRGPKTGNGSVSGRGGRGMSVKDLLSC